MYVHSTVEQNAWFIAYQLFVDLKGKIKNEIDYIKGQNILNNFPVFIWCFYLFTRI